MANQEQLELLKQNIEDWNKWREDHPNTNIDLSGADLRQANLRKVNLTHTNLRGANLRKADLNRADLRGADVMDAILIATDLTRANLITASFSRSDLRVATLTGANLTEAILRGTDLTRANLASADLTGSQIGNTTFGNNDLSSSVGLERTWHAEPSIIGIDTIRHSKGKIPVKFLRGCGLSDLEIEYAKLAAPGLDPDQVAQITYEIHRLYCDQPIQFYSCFISYNSKDQDFAQRLHDELQSNGVRCWFAPEDLKIGDEFRKAIGKEIRIRDKLLIILSKHSIQSEWVGDEVEKALAEEKEQGALKLFPIRLDDAVLKAKDDWAEKIRLRRHIGDFSTNYAKAFEKLLRDLKQ